MSVVMKKVTIPAQEREEIDYVVCDLCGDKIENPVVFFAKAVAWNNLPPPAYQTDEAAGMDLQACLLDAIPVEIFPRERKVVMTGWRVAVPKGYEGQVRPRSGLALKNGVTVLNSPGTIDSDYRGELGVILINHSDAPFIVEHGMRIAQFIIAPVAQANIQVVDELPAADSNRSGGFGSTGIHDRAEPDDEEDEGLDKFETFEGILTDLGGRMALAGVPDPEDAVRFLIAGLERLCQHYLATKVISDFQVGRKASANGKDTLVIVQYKSWGMKSSRSPSAYRRQDFVIQARQEAK